MKKFTQHGVGVWPDGKSLNKVIPNLHARIRAFIRGRVRRKPIKRDLIRAKIRLNNRRVSVWPRIVRRQRWARNSHYVVGNVRTHQRQLRACSLRNKISSFVHQHKATVVAQAAFIHWPTARGKSSRAFQRIHMQRRHLNGVGGAMWCVR